MPFMSALDQSGLALSKEVGFETPQQISDMQRNRLPGEWPACGLDDAEDPSSRSVRRRQHDLRLDPSLELLVPSLMVRALHH